MGELALFQTIDEAIEAAAQHLPEGFRVIIAVEKHGYGVHLEHEHKDHDVDGGDGMRSDVWEAIQLASEISKGGDV